MKIFKNKSFNIALALSLTMSTCYTQAFWPAQLVKKGFSAVKSKLLGASKKNTGISRKKLALGITIAAVALVAVVYAIFNYTGQRGADNALLRASEEDNLDEVRRLHEQGANLEYVGCIKRRLTPDRNSIHYHLFPNIDYYHITLVTPLLYAIMNENMEMIEYLVGQGVDINKYPVIIEGNRTHRTHHRGYRPLNAALLWNKPAIIRYLIDNGAHTHYLPTYARLKHAEKYAEMASVRPDSLTKYLHNNTSTSDLEKMVNDLDNCPCCLRQGALTVLYAKYKQNDPSLSSKKESLEKLFGTVPFNEWFLQELHKVNAIKFIVQNNITDKFGRDAVTACTQCCQDEDVIDAITANHFQTLGTKTTTRPEHALRVLRSLLAENQENPEDEKGSLEEMLQRTKKRNKKVYRQLLNRTRVYAQLGQTKFPGEISSHIVSFLDSRPTNEIAEENEDVIEQ